MTNEQIADELDRLYVAFATNHADLGRFVEEHIDGILAALRAEPTAEQVERAAAGLLRKYEQWEADWIMADDCWRNGLPSMNQALWDRYLELQHERNVALRAARSAP